MNLGLKKEPFSVADLKPEKPGIKEIFLVADSKRENSRDENTFGRSIRMKLYSASSFPQL